VIDQPIVVNWSISDLPPSDVERRWHADVPAALQPAVEEFVNRVHFFELPGTFAGHALDGRDLGSYTIAVAMGSRSHTVRFSDSTQTTALAEFRAWLMEHMAPIATAE
jgi:hypothetical protein